MKILRSHILVIFILTALLSYGCSQDTNNTKIPETSTIIENIINTGNSIESFYAEVEETHSSEVTINYRVWTQGEKSRFEGTMSGIGDITQVSDSKTVWLYLKQRNVVFVHERSKVYTYKAGPVYSDGVSWGGATVTEISFIYDEGILPLMRSIEDYAVEVKGRQTIGNQQTIVLSLSDQKTSVPVSMTWWINPDSWIPVQQKIEANHYSRTITYKNYKINEPIDDSLFVLDPPSDVTITDDPNMLFPSHTISLEDASRIAAYRVATLTFIPKGFSEKQNIHVSKPVGDLPVRVTQIWSGKEKQYISLEQSTIHTSLGNGEATNINGLDGEKSLTNNGSKYPILSLAWRDGDRSYILSGTLSDSLNEKTMYNIADSIK